MLERSVLSDWSVRLILMSIEEQEIRRSIYIITEVMVDFVAHVTYRRQAAPGLSLLVLSCANCQSVRLCVYRTEERWSVSHK